MIVSFFIYALEEAEALDYSKRIIKPFLEFLKTDFACKSEKYWKIPEMYVIEYSSCCEEIIEDNFLQWKELLYNIGTRWEIIEENKKIPTGYVISETMNDCNIFDKLAMVDIILENNKSFKLLASVNWSVVFRISRI